MKYYLDEDLSPKIAEILRKHNIDAISAHEIGMVEVTDIEQLDLAHPDYRALFARICASS